MEFYIYDITLLILFSLGVGFFLYKNRRKLNREMKIIYFYRTKVGLKLIDYIGGKYKKSLHVLKYFAIVISYILMAGILFLIGRTVYLYIRYPKEVLEIVKAPPIAPVIPYFPKLFGMESFFPPFYFIYFILALSIVAIVHEFSHGIFAKLYNLRIKSTGILFLGPILGAFVEQDEKQMNKLSKIGQMSILSAGVFANIIASIVFLLFWIGIFYATFIPSGAMFNTYFVNNVSIDSINAIGGIPVNNLNNQEIIKLIEENNLTSDLILEDGNVSVIFTKIIADEKNYFIPSDDLKKQLQNKQDSIFLYEDLPAINAGLKGTIKEIDGNEIIYYNEVGEILKNYNIGDEMNIKTEFEGNLLSYNIILEESPINPEKPMIGIGNIDTRENIADKLAFFKDPFTEYKTRHESLLFLYYLIFWIFFINLLVAFFNMLPVSILDGGRFFYLTVWKITKREKIAKIVYNWTGRIILFMFILMMLRWFFGIIG